MDFTTEIRFQTTRSGGKGGQNVNKVETAVIAYFNVPESALLSDQQKATVLEKLSNRINADNEIVVRSQEHRTQLSNKATALLKMNELVSTALYRKKARISTKTPKAVKEKRLLGKKQKGEAKATRRKIRPGDF